MPTYKRGCPNAQLNIDFKLSIFPRRLLLRDEDFQHHSAVGSASGTVCRFAAIMRGPRRFLLLLLLASATCVVLVWNLKGAFQSAERASIKVKYKKPKIPVRITDHKQERIQELMKKSDIRGGSSIEPLKALQSIPLADAKNVTIVFIITYFRDGSTFLGDLLQQHWRTFYDCEYLHSMTRGTRIGDDKIPEAFDLFNDIIKCNFLKRKEYMKWVKLPRNYFLFPHNLFLWDTCKGNRKICYNPFFVEAVCLRAPIHVMKLVRLHMRQLRIYLQDNPDLKFKVVYLNRGPRGILSSRWKLDLCKGTDCTNPDVLCHEMAEDSKIFEIFQREHPSNFTNVRYEDLCLNLEKEGRKLYKFLGLPFSPTVQKFLKTHTVGNSTDYNNPYSTRRNSTANAFIWRQRLTYNQVLNVQSTCRNVLTKMNHSLITNAEELKYPDG